MGQFSDQRESPVFRHLIERAIEFPCAYQEASSLLLAQQPTGAIPENCRQRVVDSVGLTEGNNGDIARHGRIGSFWSSGRLVTRLDTPPLSRPHHPISRIAPTLLRLAYVCGLRRAELSELRWRHFARRKDGAVLTIIGKGSRVRHIFLPKYIAASVRRTLWITARRFMSCSIRLAIPHTAALKK